MIKKYNKIIKGCDKNLMVDQILVDLRDAIAHGRVFTNGNSDSFQLLKFSQPKNGNVKVDFCANMTEEWFRKHINVLRENIIKIQHTLEKLEHGELF